MDRLLDINDRDIGLLGSEQALKSPGYAVLANKELVFGVEARAMSRLNPGLSANQYWRDLSTQKSSANFPAIRHQADLAWNHLQTFDREQLKEVSLVAVPSHYGTEQIALLSGILKSLEVSETLLCKRSLLMASQYPEAEYHVDFQLHQMVITKIEKQGKEIACGEIMEYPGLGLLGCSDALLKGIQSRFIDKTRFDPLHHAVTEQQLFNQIVERLLPQKWSRIDLTIELDEQKNSIELSEQQLELSVNDYLQKIADALPRGAYVADEIFGNLPIQSKGAFYLAETDIAQTLSEILSRAEPEQEYSELTAIAPKSSSPEVASNNAENIEVVGEATPDSESRDLMDEQSEQAGEPPAVGGTVTHIMSDGNALPALNSVIVARENRISPAVDTPELDGVLGRFVLDSGNLLLVNEAGLSLNGSHFSGSREVSVKDVISHDDYAGTLVAIQVAT